MTHETNTSENKGIKRHLDSVMDIANFAADFPRSGLSLDLVKFLAAALMVLDHINVLFLNLDTTYWLVGRTVFPLFCFVVAVHVERGIAPMRYLLKLLPFAVISQIPYFWTFHERLFFDPLYMYWTLNVIFTLGLGGAFAALLINRHWAWQAVFFAAMVALKIYVPYSVVEYGSIGVAFPLALALLMRRRWDGLIYSVICALLANAVFTDFITFEQNKSFIIGPGMFIMLGVPAIVTVCAMFDSDERFLPKYFFHIFYPLHFAIMGAILEFDLLG